MQAAHLEKLNEGQRAAVKREIASATWGMPTPPAFIKGNYDPGVTNIRNLAYPLLHNPRCH